MRRPLFLAPVSYRRRRLRDAARLLPLAGLLLMILPILWSPPNGGDRLLSSDVIWFFATWLLLILVAGALAPGLAIPETGRLPGEGGAGPDGRARDGEGQEDAVPGPAGVNTGAPRAPGPGAEG